MKTPTGPLDDAERAARVAAASPARASGSGAAAREARGGAIDEGSRQSAGDAIPQGCVLIEVRVSELKQLFNSIDPSPFGTRDLDPAAEEFIVGWAKESPRDAPLALLVHLDRAAGRADEAAALRDAIDEFFRERAGASRRRLRELFRVGRISLVIGILFLALMTGAGNLIVHVTRGRGLADVVRESLLIGGWVAMWRPLEIFLYGWWPIRREARLYDRLGSMPVRIVYPGDVRPEAWRSDWPVVGGDP